MPDSLSPHSPELRSPIDWQAPWDERRVQALGPALITAANTAGLGLAVVLIEAPEPRVVYMTEIGAQIIGHPSDSVVGRPAIGFLTPEEREIHNRSPELLTRIPADRLTFETTALTFDERRVPIEVSMAPMRLDGQLIAVVFFRDISDRHRARKEMETRLVRTDRLAALGTLLGGIAHEMNNPLAYVLLGIDQVCAGLDHVGTGPGHDAAEVSRLREILEEVRQGANRVAAVVKQLRANSRPDTQEGRVVDVGQALQAALRMAGNEIRHRAHLLTSLETIPTIEGSAQRLEQVFLNLLVNAAQALPEGRVENEIRVTVGKAAGEMIAVEISDNGDGISPEVLPGIFDPFFTTKEVDVGMRLGLSICHGIVTAHGGTIDVDSERGRGTRFRVLLPIRRNGTPAEAPVEPPTPLAVSAGRRRRILVVDDEPALGAMIQRMLLEDFEVDVVTDGREGLDRLCAGPLYHTVLCDLMMPEMTGMDLHAMAAQKRPGLERRFVFMTGGAFTPRSAEFLATVRNRRLEKPFDLATLRAVVDRV